MPTPLKTERRAYLWRVVARAFPEDAHKAGTEATLDEIISVLEAEQTAGKARIYLGGNSRPLDDTDVANRDEKNQIYVARILRDPKAQVVSILINRGDPNAVSPAFLNASSNAVRVEHPKPHETPGWSAHLVIALNEIDGAHRACFEQMSHVPSSTILMALDRIIWKALKDNPHYKFDSVTQVKGKKKLVSKSYRPGLKVDRVPSETLQDDIEAGSLKGITLTKKSIFYGGPGADNLVRRQQQKVVITLAPSKDKEKIRNFVENIIQQAKTANYESVTFNVDDLPGGQSSSPTISIDDEDAMDQLYVRAKRLTDFSTHLEQCYADICGEIVSKMVDIIADDKSW